MISPLTLLQSNSYTSYPLQLKGLKLLLDSTVGVTSTSGVVTGWNDVTSGNGGTWGQATASLRPTVATNSLNGKQTIRFNGSVLYSTNNSYNMGTDSLLMYIVTSMDGVNGGVGGNGMPAGTLGHVCGCRGFVINGQSVGRYHISRDVNNYTQGGTWTSGTWVLTDAIAQFSSAWRVYMLNIPRVSTGALEITYYVHERKFTTASSDNKGNWVPGATFNIGGICASDKTQFTSESTATSVGNNGFFRGNVAEVGLYQRDWPYRPDEIRKLQKYLQLKWGLSAI